MWTSTLSLPLRSLQTRRYMQTRGTPRPHDPIEVGWVGRSARQAAAARRSRAGGAAGPSRPASARRSRLDLSPAPVCAPAQRWCGDATGEVAARADGARAARRTLAATGCADAARRRRAARRRQRSRRPIWRLAREISEAYDTLKDPSRRSAYDAGGFSTGTAGGGAAGSRGPRPGSQREPKPQPAASAARSRYEGGYL